MLLDSIHLISQLKEKYPCQVYQPVDKTCLSVMKKWQLHKLIQLILVCKAYSSGLIPKQCSLLLEKRLSPSFSITGANNITSTNIQLEPCFCASNPCIRVGVIFLKCQMTHISMKYFLFSMCSVQTVMHVDGWRWERFQSGFNTVKQAWSCNPSRQRYHT